MAANNQGIVHLRIGQSRWGAMIACKNRRTHVAVPFDRFGDEPRQCVRCLVAFGKMKARLACQREG